MRARTTQLLVPLAFAVASLLGMPAARAQDQPSARTSALVDLINHARVNAGLLPLARSPELDSAAQGHSVDMVQHNYLDHTGSDGSEPQDRADKAGYHVPPNSGWIVVEVISAISGDPQGPLDWWLGDEQHHNVVLNPRWREIGVGYAQGGDYGNYWTADFGCRPGVLPTITLDEVSYTQTEQCGDPGVGAALAATPAVQPSPTSSAAPATPTPPPTLTPPPIAAQPTFAPTVSAQQLGASVTITWTGIAQPKSTDWLGIYRPRDTDTDFLEWAYVSCTRQPDQGRASGNCTLAMPVSSSNYEVRLFGGNAFTRLAPPAPVLLATRQPTVEVMPDTANRGSAVNVRWQGIDSATRTDWIGLYRSGDSDASPLLWQYAGCAQVPLDARPLGSCNVLIPTDFVVGTYEFRLFGANGYQRLAVSASVRIT